MSAAAAVRDAGTPHRMLRAANARIGNRAIGLAELGQRDTGELGPERVRSIEVQTLVEVESNPQPRLVHVEESAQPGAEEAHHPGVAAREPDLAVGLVAPPAYSAVPATNRSRSDSRPIRSRPSTTNRSISACLRCWSRFGRRFRAPRLRFVTDRAGRVAASNSTSRTQTLTLLLDTPSWATISLIVHACARRSRARARSTTFPPGIPSPHARGAL